MHIYPRVLKEKLEQSAHFAEWLYFLDFLEIKINFLRIRLAVITAGIIFRALMTIQLRSQKTENSFFPSEFSTIQASSYYFRLKSKLQEHLNLDFMFHQVE